MRSIANDDPVRITSFLGPETLLLGLAIGIALLFVGLLIFDQLRRRKRTHRMGGPFEGFRPFQQMKKLREEFKALARERERRKLHNQGRRPGTRR